jgi:hypothetical protein
MATINPPAGNITSLNQIFEWTNTSVNSLLFPGILGAVFFIIFVRLLYSTNETGKAFASSAFICMILAVLFRTVNLINTTFMVIFIILTAIGAIWLHIENAK